MATNSLTDRTDSGALIPEDVAAGIIQDVTSESAVMRLARRLPNMSRAQQRLPVLGTFPSAYFVNGDTGIKQTTEMSWESVYLNAEELAVIVPVPENVIDDADYDVWAQIRPHLVEAFGIAFDQAVLYGTNAPSSWPDDLVTAATAAGHVVDNDTAGYSDLYDMILGEGSGGEKSVFGYVEEDGFMVNGSVAAPSMKASFRGLRDANGQPIFVRSMQDTTRYELDGSPVEFTSSGAFNTSSALLIAGDWNQLVYSIRQDLTFKVATEATIMNNAKGIEYNLFQQDMVALRAKMRIAWALPNPPKRLNQNDTTRYPFALLKD